MNALARAPDADEPSALDQIAGAAVHLVLFASRSKAAAMLALSRLAMEEYVKLEGHQNASRFHARRARLHEESWQKQIRGRGQ